MNQSWMTTDAEEREKRRERAKMESMRVRIVHAPDGFGSYEVSHPAEDRRTAVYHVELRSRQEDANTCDCPDFRKSGLGTCKHIERVIRTSTRKCGSRLRSSSAEVFMCREPYVPMFWAGERLSNEARKTLLRLCDANGVVRDRSAPGVEAFLRTCDRLNEIVPDSVNVSFEVRDWLAEQIRGESLRRAIGAFRDRQGEDGHWPFLKQTLYPYQREGAYHLAGKGRAILADEMGLGKTVQGIAAALLLKETVGIARTLVVVPTSLKGEWEEQIQFFSDATFESLYGMRQIRLERYARTRAFFVIANYEQVIRDWKEINDILKPDLVILDEAQRIKNWKTKTARNIKALSSPHAFVLTGTPLENRIDELYSLVDFVDPRLFGSLFRFNRRYYAFDDEGKNEGMCNLDKLHETTAQVLLRRRKAAVESDLPGRRSKTYKTGMTPEQERRYSAHMKNVAGLYETSKRRPLTPKEQERLQIELGLMRMLCDTCYITDQKIRDSPKLDEFEDVLDDIFADDPTRKVIVFSEWTRMLDLLIERLEKKRIAFALHTGQVPQKRRREEIRRFKEDPNCRLFLASESGGVGLNLQIASVVVNLDMPWNPAKLEQRIARAWRKNQRRDVLVVNMVAGGTIEERMLQTLSFKQGLADFVLDAVGDAADFERQNAEEARSRRKPSAFMQRLASIMGGGAVRVEPTEPRGTETTIPPEERLRASVEMQCPNIERMSVLMRGEEGHRQVGGAIAVGRHLDKRAIAQSIAETQGVALPDESIETIDAETWRQVKRLEALGVIRFCDHDVKDVIVRDVPDVVRQERQRRKIRATEQMSEARRQLDMGELLMKGGFDVEAQAVLRKAVAFAAAVSSYARGKGDVEDEIAPITLDELMSVRESLALSAEQALVLQLAVQGMVLPDPVKDARRFVEGIQLGDIPSDPGRVCW